MEMDVEKTIEFILEQSADTAAMLEQAKAQADAHLALTAPQKFPPHCFQPLAQNASRIRSAPPLVSR